MESNSKEERRRIFQNELYTLKERGYVTTDQYKMVSEAHNEYFADILAKEQLKIEAEQEGHSTSAIAYLEESPVPQKMLKKPVKQRPVKIMQKKTAEEVRERNISWSLNIGVIMLLIGGLFVATSNWETMDPWMKAGSIALVSALFYGIAFISFRILKIEKTAFAFVVLGSLFLPIFALSLGWFELLGAYLSFNGEGRFILGFISSTILVPIYAMLATRMSSRLFVWFSFIALTAAAAYSLKATGLAADGFYLGMMIFNSLLITGYHSLKTKGQLPLFKKELALFSQANLILITLLMLLFFENQIFNGFNLILTSAMYLSMIYVTGRKEYHFVFSAMFVYGAYQILGHLNLPEAGFIGYSLLGFVFLLVPKILSDQYALKKTFQVTSALVSGFAFILITVEGMLLRSEQPSLTLLSAYLIIAANFLYLANQSERNIIFRYLSPIFLASALFEATLKLDQLFDFGTLILPIYFIGFVLFTLFGWQIKSKYFIAIHASSRDIGMSLTILTSLAAFALHQWWEMGLILFLNSALFYLMVKIERRPSLLLAAIWGLPFSLGLSVAAFGEEFYYRSNFYHDFLGMAGDFAAAAILLLIASSIFRKKKENGLSNSSFYTSHVFYLVALILTIDMPVPNYYGESLIWFGGILMSALLYIKSRGKWLVYLPGIIGLAWYNITLYELDENVFHFSGPFETLILPGGAWLLLAAALLILKKDRVIAEGLVWVAHLYTVPVMALVYAAYEEQALWSYMIATVIYTISVLFVKKEWKINVLLYGAFTALFFTLKIGIWYITGEDSGYYAFMAASILIGTFWALSSESFKRRASFYLVPFSLLGIASFLLVYPYSWVLFGFTLIYAAGVLVFLHQLKWDLLTSIPLMMVFYAAMQIIFQARMEAEYDIALLAAFGIVFLFKGKTLYQKLWVGNGISGAKSIDFYTITSFVFFASIYLSKTETFWAEIVHGLLISAAFLIQRNRVQIKLKPFMILISGIYLLIPYYAALGQLAIPPLWERELYVLPLIAIVIFLRFVAKGKQEQFTSYIQWAALIFVSLALVQDGLESHTVYDALILGTLSLLAMMAGMWLRIKAYFFVGAGVLLLNIFLQTRPYWGNMPWWGYLLISGTILISIASFIEWNKQKGAKGEKTLIDKLKESISARLKNWN